jgi:hypothetical protein
VVLIYESARCPLFGLWGADNNNPSIIIMAAYTAIFAVLATRLTLLDAYRIDPDHDIAHLAPDMQQRLMEIFGDAEGSIIAKDLLLLSIVAPRVG